ncbi:putative E3 ubiquitin-protein ligase UBR7 [Pseudophryne corroboree]|uniref:putative E3 ubiquitin-protein ligase UBR7 n=1 Tax=Pseudophryne corroboree TaxID=495146 RepID=UPI003082184B
MAAEDGQREKLSAEEAHAEDPVLSLQDVLEEDDALESEASAVLAGSDAEKCSYPENYVKRQALYACSTCTPNKEEPAGICLACSYTCHEGHDLFELYTKRNFRCDCGNDKFKNLKCKLFPEKEKVNIDNKYNENFFGLYCTCKRPYPDPEDETPDEMIQCIVCEDWFHGRHLGESPPEHVESLEMVCPGCTQRCSFLRAYCTKIGVPGFTKIVPADKDLEDIKVDDDPVEISNVLNRPDIKREEETAGVANPQDVKEEKQSSPSSSASCNQKYEEGSCSIKKEEVKPSTACQLREYQDHQGPTKDTATYWPGNWRRKLCRCEECMKMYVELDVLFLLDESDTVQAYENKGKLEEARETRDPLMTALGNMNRIQQVELICEYNDLKSELSEYLKKFAEEGKVVQTQDIQTFFEDLRSRKRRRLDRMQYYCS